MFQPDRRSLLGLLATALTAPAALAAEPLAAIEAATGGRLGLAAMDTGSGRRVGHRADERFAMASTFKWLLAACVLQRVDGGRVSLDQAVSFGAADLVPYAPVVEQHLKAGRLSVRELCRATVVLSDNVAANLLLPLVGGPAGLTDWLRETGDATTRLDRHEPGLNENQPNDPRDTTTPAAMAASLQRLLLGGPLTVPSRERLIGWMKESPTGARRLRAALPPDWPAGDKTGTGARGAVNDVAIVWPPGRPPWVVACYLSDATLPVMQLEPAHVKAMAAVRDAFA